MRAVRNGFLGAPLPAGPCRGIALHLVERGCRRAGEVRLVPKLTPDFTPISMSSQPGTRRSRLAFRKPDTRRANQIAVELAGRRPSNAFDSG